MTDPLSIAAGVAGFAGLSGQIFSGCLFIKSFLEDVKNAPEDIAELKAELETLSAAAKSFERLVNECSRDGLVITTEDYNPALKQCLDVINGLQRYVSAEVSKFAEGKRWRDRVKSAGKNSAIEKHLARLSRANASVQMTQNNLVASLQQRSQASIQQLHGSIIDSTIPIHEIKHNQLELASDFQRLDKNLQEELSAARHQGSTTIGLLARNQDTVSSGFREIGSTLQDIKAQMAEGRASVAQINSDFLNNLVQTSVQSAISLFHKEFACPEESRPKQVMKSSTSEHEPDKKSKGLALSRRRLLYNRTYNFYLVQVQIRRHGTFDNSCRALPTSSRDTVLVHFNLPRFCRGFSYTKNSIHELCAGGISYSLRSYNVVPDGHPLWEACDALDTVKVQELFATGRASPFDVCVDGRTALSRVFDSFDIASLRPHTRIWSPSLYEEMSLKVLNLMSLLAKYEEFYDEHYFWIRIIWHFKFMIQLGYPVRFLSDIFRFLLERDCFPPESVGRGSGPFHTSLLTLDMRDTEIYTVLQQHGATKLPAFQARIEPQGLAENSHQMLEDPDALLLKEAFTYTIPSKYYLSSEKLLSSTLCRLLSLHLLAPPKYVNDLRFACLSRLGILLTHSQYKNLRKRGAVSMLPSVAKQLGMPIPDKSLRHPSKTTWEHEEKPWFYLSTLEFATAIGERALIHEALLLAGWSSHDIENLYDEELYDGIPNLLNHNDDLTPYLTRTEARVAFKDLICRGAFLKYETSKEWGHMHGKQTGYMTNLEELEEISNEWGTAMQVSPWGIQKVIESANLAWRQRDTPGSWPEENELGKGEKGTLVPGKDFTCFCRHSRGSLWCICEE